MAEVHRKTHGFIAPLARYLNALKREFFEAYGGGSVTGSSAADGTGATGASGTGAITGAPATAAAAAFATFVAPAAAGVDVHAAIASDNAAPVTTGITNPAIPRSLQVVFAALWDGGDVTVEGTDYLTGAAVSETFLNVPGTTVEGSKVFATVTSISNQTVGAGGALTATVQTGTKLGLAALPAGPGSIATVDGVLDAADLGTTYGSVLFTTAPNGARNFVLSYAAVHTHGLGTLAGPSHTHTGPSHTHGAGTFAAGPVTAPIHFDRAEVSITAATATDLETSRTLLRGIAIVYYNHINDTLAHAAVDATNVLSDTLAQVLVEIDAGVLGALQTYANEIKASYNAHRSESGVHAADDSGHEITSPDASSQGSLNTLLNELKTDLNAHLASGLTTQSWRVLDA